jgi:toxin HigB-1
MKTEVHLTKNSKKQIQKAPVYIKQAILEWIESVEAFGLEETRRAGGKGLHDEPLSGELKGTRSIRLNRSWRLYYTEKRGEIVLVTVVRVDHHKY